MSSDLNRVMLIGRLTRDPELRHTQNGTAICSFSIANNKTYKQQDEKKEQVSFFNCVAWSKLGEVIVQYCQKGHRVALEGRLQQRTWDDPEGNKRSAVEVVVENFQFLQSKGESDTQGQSGNQAPSNTPAADNPFSDDDIPW